MRVNILIRIGKGFEESRVLVKVDDRVIGTPCSLVTFRMASLFAVIQ